jgi:hypothetical protein
MVFINSSSKNADENGAEAALLAPINTRYQRISIILNYG